MTQSAKSTPITIISSNELNHLIRRAKEEEWDTLFILDPIVRNNSYIINSIRSNIAPNTPIYQLKTTVANLPTLVCPLVHLTTLILVGHRFGEKEAKALAQLTQLTSLNLHGNKIGEEGAKALAQLTQLTSLNLHGNNIGEEGAKALAQLTQLTSLNLHGNKIGEEGAKALAQLTQLTSLDLNGNNIGEEGAKALAQLTQLTSLDLNGNNIGEEGAKALAQLTQLTSLDLNVNKIGEEGAKALAQLTQLTSLHLHGNNIGEEGAKALAQLTQLTSLHLHGNNIGEEGAKALAQLTQLTSLDLAFNNIGEEGAKALAQLTQLTSLHLHGNNIGEEGAKALAQLTQLTSLDLAFNNIGEEGAKALAQLTQLTSLDLNGNNIGEEGAKALAQLTQLTSLHLHGNNIGEEGAKALAQLTQLTSLHLHGNNIGEEGAKALAQLTQLTSLDLNVNNIGEEGAKALAQLTQLTSLHLHGNNIGEEGAKALAQLTQLTSLDLNVNNIGEEGAKALAQLTQLTSLHLHGNNIGEEGAKALAQLTQLTSLDLAFNNIGEEGARVILEAWANRRGTIRFGYLSLSDNGDLTSLLPAEVIGNKYNPDEILTAYLRFRGSPRKPLNECKLLVVGNEAVGKTSLIRFLIDGKTRNPSEEKTPGISINERINVRNWAIPSNNNIRLNIWDFGGQEMMRGTHRFFLTPRSLYILVLEDRRQDDRSIDTWLKTVKNCGKKAPILVIINKSDEGKEELRLDERTLKEQYPEIVAFHRTSCNKGEWAQKSIQELRKQIAQVIIEDERLTHVRDLIPVSWLSVKEQIETLASDRKTLPVREFERICEKIETDEGSALTEDTEQKALLRLLHDLGTIVAHGLTDKSSAAYREVTLLDPNWLTQAIYTILNHPQVRDQQGEFGRKQLKKWLEPTLYPEERHEFIIGMMQDEDIELCFLLEKRNGEERYLVPEALPKNKPDYKDIWPEDDSLRFRYKYDFLPSGLIPRFLVKSHYNLTHDKTRWHKGAVLQSEGCKVWVEASLSQIDIKITGPQNRRRSALSVILDHLHVVHNLNPECGPKAYVPLPNNPILEVSYELLLKYEERYDSNHSILVDGYPGDLRVGELLDGVRHEPPTTFARTPTIENSTSIPQTQSLAWRWPAIATFAAFIAMSLVALLFWAPLGESRLAWTALVAVGVGVFLFTMRANPDLFFRNIVYSSSTALVLDISFKLQLFGNSLQLESSFLSTLFLGLALVISLIFEGLRRFPSLQNKIAN